MRYLYLSRRFTRFAWRTDCQKSWHRFIANMHRWTVRAYMKWITLLPLLRRIGPSGRWYLC